MTKVLKPKNYGLDWKRELAEQSEEDYVFGAASPPCIAAIPRKEREAFLPAGEVQRGREDFRDCATRGPINILEAKFTYLYARKLIKPEHLEWLERNGYVEGDRVLFADRFNAIKSGTTREGNSLKAPCQSIHEHGLIPKKMLPAERWMTWRSYHSPASITPEMEELGKEFAERFLINYERVYLNNFDRLIEEDILVVAGYAWPLPINGEYPKDERAPNHAFISFDAPRYIIFDNYVEVGSTDDFIKKLAPDYALVEHGYRLRISETQGEQRRALMLQLIELLKQYVELLSRKLAGIGRLLGVWS